MNLSDYSNSLIYNFLCKRSTRWTSKHFWDIENVAIPAGNNAFDILMELRKQLIEDRKFVEGTFKTYCRNINNIAQKHRTDLYHANVMVQHLESTKTGAVDMQIHKDLQQFMEQNKTPSTVVLISGNIGFVKDINELRFRCRHYTIVIHNSQVEEQLRKTANEFICWDKFVVKKNVKSRDNSERTSSPRHSLDKIAVNTNNNVSESTVTTVDQSKMGQPHQCSENSDVVKKESRSQKKRSKNENKPDIKSSKPLMTPTSDSTNATAVDDSAVVSSTDEIVKLTENKSADMTTTFSCPMCDKKFSSDIGRIAHEQSKHKAKTFSCSMCDKKFSTDVGRMTHEQKKQNVGILVEISPETSTNNSQSHNQPSEHDDPSTIDLIAFADGGDDCHVAQSDLPTTTIKTNSSVKDNSDGDDTSESASELHDSVRLQTESQDDGEPTQTDIVKNLDDNN